MSKHVVASVSDIPPGEKKLVTVRGRPIAIFNLGGEFFGLLNRCPHQGGSLCDGVVTGLVQSTEPGKYTYTRKGEIVRCPWHGWEFDIRTGQSWCEPSRIQVRAYPVEVAHGGTLVAAPGSGDQMVEGPYVAETVQVSVENDYVVVDV
jgi:nitrite reductase/ring-hydroxylating ferredoxin subunit